MKKAPNPPPAYLPTLNGWRAVAVTAVIIDHAGQTFIEAGRGNPRALPVVSSGGYGVDLFFAISGFLICNRLLREWSVTGGISLQEFYLRRAFRILPLYWAYLLVLTLLALVAGLGVSDQELTACILFYRNYLPPSPGYDTYTSHFWSLSVEEHFYLIWPAFLLFFRPKHALWATPLFALLVHGWRSLDVRLHLSQAFFHDSHLLVYWRTDVRLDALWWGCFAALLCYFRTPRVLPGWLPWAVLTSLAGAVGLRAPALPLVLATLFPALIVSTVYGPKSGIGRFLELSPVRWIGRLSYSLYIWQTLFLQTSRAPDPSWLAALKHFPMNLVAIVICAVLTHYLVERPMIRLGQRLTHRKDEHPASTSAHHGDAPAHLPDPTCPASQEGSTA